ncbi:hypothetical protein HDU76_001245 [Blyttiomyces sp. JEL0837]|nr:hypothetical protein HDU76_001245 [Blyttiomyces sp. JEL0837]
MIAGFILTLSSTAPVSLDSEKRGLKRPAEFDVDRSEIDRSIHGFIQRKRAQIDESNRKEFLAPSHGNDPGSARVDASSVNRNLIKLDQVQNDVALSRSMNRSKPIADANPKHADAERIGNLEDHLRVLIGKFILPKLDGSSDTLQAPSASDLSLHDRLKIVEDKIINLEKAYPPWSMVHFNGPSASGQGPGSDRLGSTVWTTVSRDSTGNVVFRQTVKAGPEFKQRRDVPPINDVGKLPKNDLPMPTAVVQESEAEAIDRRIKDLTESLMLKSKLQKK